MVFDTRNLGRTRQKLIEVAAPAGRVQPVAITSRRSPIQHLFDAPTRIQIWRLNARFLATSLE
jgi:hypothetical protein